MNRRSFVKGLVAAFAGILGRPNAQAMPTPLPAPKTPQIARLYMARIICVESVDLGFGYWRVVYHFEFLNGECGKLKQEGDFKPPLRLFPQMEYVAVYKLPGDSFWSTKQTPPIYQNPTP